MTIKQVEDKIIALKHGEPFVPFAVELTDGQTVKILQPCLAINETGMGFVGADGGIVDIEFDQVCNIRPLSAEAAA